MRKAFAILDNLMPQFKDTDAAFVRDYENARVIVDAGDRHDKSEPPKV